MLKITRVTVVEEWTDEDGERQYEAVLEMAAPAKMLAGWDVAGNVSDVVHGLAGVALAEASAPTNLSPAALATVHVLPDVPDRIVTTEQAPVEPSAPAAEGDKPKRNRRTKAQIAADKEAQELGFRDAAHRAEATVSGPGATPVAEADEPGQSDQDAASAAGADPGPEAGAVLAERAASAAADGAPEGYAPGYMTPDGSVVAEAPAPAPGPAEQVAPAASTTLPAGEPWNPFARG